MTSQVVPAPDLLTIAERVLRRHGFALERTSTATAVEMILAENEFCVIGLAASASVDSLPFLEAEASALMANRVESSNVGAKRWDIYLVLLTPDRPPQADTTALFSIAYNTRLFRRIVRTGLTLTDEDVEMALKAFLPLTPAEHPEMASDALTLLSAELPSHGVDKRTAERAIATFRATGAIDDV